MMDEQRAVPRGLLAWLVSGALGLIVASDGF
jgi:hypothetical protein